VREKGRIVYDSVLLVWQSYCHNTERGTVSTAAESQLLS